MYELNVEDEFASAHYLRGYKGKCERVHGHNYRVMITVKAKKLNKIGLAVDFSEIKVELKKNMEILDHRLLDELPCFKKVNPSAENIAKYIFRGRIYFFKTRKFIQQTMIKYFHIFFKLNFNLRKIHSQSNFIKLFCFYRDHDPIIMTVYSFTFTFITPEVMRRSKLVFYI